MINPLSFLRKQPPAFLTAEENKRITEAIKQAEMQTSGEIRVYIESKNRFVDPMDRAKEIFQYLKMQETQHRNAVLLYIAMKDKELALFADEGIYQKTGADYWNAAANTMLEAFKRTDFATGIEQCIATIGQTLKAQFPFEATTDKNELPDEIVFGK